MKEFLNNIRSVADYVLFEFLLFLLDDYSQQTLRKIRSNDSELKHITLKRKNLSPNGINALSMALLTNSNLTNISLENSRIDDTDLRCIFHFLQYNSSVVVLQLVFNKLEDSGAKEIANLLKTNKTLNKLYLVSNGIGIEGAKDIATSLLTNTTLNTLNLANNFLVHEGAEYCANILKYNCSLIELNISNNVIGTVGTKSLANALKCNTSVVSLNLLGNYIGIEGSRAILEALNTNTIITDIYYYDHQDVNNNLKTLINAALKRNQDFKEEIEKITKPLYVLDNIGCPVWQSNPLRNAEMLDEKIKEIIASNPIFKNSKLLQELYGLQYLCLAHHFFNVYLFSKNQNYKDVLDLVIKCLKLAEVMGYHVQLSHKMALDMINDVDMTDNLESQYYRKYLDENLPGKNEQHRIDLRESYPGYYGYSRLRLQKALNRQTESSVEELKHAKPLKHFNMKKN